MLSPVTASTDLDRKHNAAPSKFKQITSDNLTLRLAETDQDILQAQRLRYEVFYKEMGAHPVGDMAELEREFEFYDAYCDHLLVIDNATNQVVGTYRILMDDVTKEKNIPFYTETEFDISKLKATGGKIMEISRSCVLASHRSKAAINLLWKGIATYVYGHGVDYLIGVASFPGVDPETEKQAFAYLTAFHLAPEEIRPVALTEQARPLPLAHKDSIDAKRSFMDLPPLLKGYLRVGAVVADTIYIDHQFNCLDIAIMMPINQVTDRYFNHYKPKDDQ